MTVQVPRANPRLPGAEEMVARRVAYERARKGWSTAELARRMTEAGVPVNQSAIYKIENGSPRRTISLDEALALAEIFGRSLDELRSLPVDLIGAELGRFVDEMSAIEAMVRQLGLKIAETLVRIIEVRADAQPVFDYMEGESATWPVIDELQDRLTDFANSTLRVRDDLAVKAGEFDQLEVIQ